MASGLRATIEGNDLVIRIPVDPDPQPSLSGKTLVVASSRGNKETEAVILGQKIVVGLNAYIYKQAS